MYMESIDVSAWTKSRDWNVGCMQTSTTVIFCCSVAIFIDNYCQLEVLIYCTPNWTPSASCGQNQRRFPSGGKSYVDSSGLIPFVQFHCSYFYYSSYVVAIRFPCGGAFRKMGWGTHFTKNLRRFNPNFAINWVGFTEQILNKSGHNMAHATTAQLSWHVQNCDLIKSLQ